MQDTRNNTYSDDILLEQAIENAELLLNHAAEHGKDLSEKAVSVIIQSKKLHDNNEWTTEAEIKFWSAYKELSGLIKPVTVQSLRASKKRFIRNRGKLKRIFNIKYKASLSRRSVRSYQILALFFIVSVVIVQVITLKGTTTLNNMQNNYKRMSEIDYRMDELRLITEADTENERAMLEYYRLESEKGRLDREIGGSIKLLVPWVSFLRKTIGQKESLPGKEETDTELSSLPPTGGPGASPQKSADAIVSENVSIIQEAQNYTQILQLYILPLLYGLIGGLIFVLRGLADDIRRQVFSNYSNIKYSLRIHLGALAGLIVGLLWGDIEKQQITFLESLSTAGLAFIAGYGVEYLFNAIDRFIGTIGSSNSDNEKPCK